MPPIAAWLFALVWFVIAAVIVRAAWRALRAAQESRRWVPVQGRVVKAWVESKIRHVANGGEGGSRRLYWARVRYAFEVEGMQRTGTYWTAADASGVTRWGSCRGAERRVRRYPVGRDLLIYFDPADPSRSALTVGAGWRDWMLLAATSSFAMLAPFWLWFGLVVLAPANMR